jgi:hypothetical protein
LRLAQRRGAHRSRAGCRIFDRIEHFSGELPIWLEHEHLDTRRPDGFGAGGRLVHCSGTESKCRTIRRHWLLFRFRNDSPRRNEKHFFATRPRGRRGKSGKTGNRRLAARGCPGERYCVCTPVVTACPLSVRTVVEQLENAANMTVAARRVRRMVRIVICDVCLANIRKGLGEWVSRSALFAAFATAVRPPQTVLPSGDG